MANGSFYDLFQVAQLGDSKTYYFTVNERWLYELGRRFYQFKGRNKIRYIMRRNKYKNQYKWD